MLKRTILAFLALTGLATAADKYTELQGLGPLPEYVVKSTNEKIVVDGRLSESAWSQDHSDHADVSVGFSDRQETENHRENCSQSGHPLRGI